MHDVTVNMHEYFRGFNVRMWGTNVLYLWSQDTVHRRNTDGGQQVISKLKDHVCF